MKKTIAIAMVMIALFVGGLVWAIPTVHTERCEVLQGRNGIVQIMTAGGEVYECYGETDAVEVEATFEDNRLVGFEKIY